MRIIFLYSLAVLCQGSAVLFTQTGSGIFGSACVSNNVNCLSFNLGATGTGISSASFPGLPNDGVLANGVKVGVSGGTAFASFGNLGAGPVGMSYSVTNGVVGSPFVGGASIIARFTDTMTIYGGTGNAYLRTRLNRCSILCQVFGSDTLAFTYGVPFTYGFELRAQASLNEILFGYLDVQGLGVVADLSNVSFPNQFSPHVSGLYYLTDSGARYGGMLDGVFLPEPGTGVLTTMAFAVALGVARRYRNCLARPRAS